MSPFIKASCGCVVLPLSREANEAGCVECIFLRACDGEEGWCFSTRHMEKRKVFDDGGDYRDGYRGPTRPRPLTADEQSRVIEAISRLTSAGQQMFELSSIMWRAGKNKSEMPIDISEGGTSCKASEPAKSSG
jgi:hypothetical protein